MKEFINLKNDNLWINPQNKKEIKQDNILCSSGTNYIVIKEDGQIYRCFHDLSPIGTIHNFNLKKNATPCNVGYICDSSSDQMFCTQWNQVDKKGYYPKNPICISWKDKDPNQIDSNNICMIIYPTMRCNFRCSYCCNYYPSSENDIRPKYEDEISINQWIDFFDKIKNQYKNTVINLNGGEPLLYKDIDILIQKIIDCNFDGSIVTNFSVFKQLDKILNIRNIDNFKFTTTLHPINKNFNFDKILEYIIKFSNKGIKQRIVVLGWPDNIPYYEKWKPIFKTLNIPLWLKWCGGYEYTQDHIQYLLKEGAGKSTAQYLDEIGWNKMNFKKISNKENNTNEIIKTEETKVFCDAGLSYVWIEPNGDILRCNTLNFKHKDKYKKIIIGNIITGKWNPVSTKEMICNHHEDCFGCDACLSTQWIKKNNNFELIERCQSPIPRKNTPLEANQEYVKYICVLTYKCNFDCLYCSTNELYNKEYEKITSEHIINFFSERIKENKRCQVIMSPMGEPTRFPNFADMIIKLAKMGIDVHITTNMSQYKVIEEITSNSDIKNNINFQMSIHPFATAFNYDRLLGTMAMIKRRGFNGFALMVGNPVQTYLFDKYKKDISEIGFELSMQEDESQYGKRNDIVPDNIRKNGTKEFEKKVQLLKKNDIIKCTAGVDYFNINAIGEVYRCIHGNLKNKDYFLGNINNLIKNFNEITKKYKNNMTCENMCCYETCEKYNVEVWKNNKKIWNNINWRNKYTIEQEINDDNILLNLSLTENCINKCVYCFHKENRDNNLTIKDIRFINYDNIILLLKFLSNRNNKKLFICGSGDAQLHPNFVEIINTATDLGYIITIFTSGLTYQEKFYKLINYNKIGISISLHPSSKNWNQSKIIQLIEYLLSKNILFLSTNVVKHKVNIKYLEDFKKLSSKYNILHFEDNFYNGFTITDTII